MLSVIIDVWIDFNQAAPSCLFVILCLSLLFEFGQQLDNLEVQSFNSWLLIINRGLANPGPIFISYTNLCINLDTVDSLITHRSDNP